VVGLALASVAVRSLPVALALFTILTFFEQIPGLGSSAPVIRLSGFALILAWTAVLASRRAKPVLLRDHPALSAVALALGAWAIASTLWGADSSTAAAGAARLAQMLGLLFVVFSAISDRRSLRLFACAFVAGAVATSLVGLAGVGADSSAGGASRFGGDLGNPNNLAGVALPALALACFLLASAARRRERLMFATAAAFLFVVILLTQSRGGLVGLAAMAVAALLYSSRARAAALAVVLAVAVSAVAYYGGGASSSARARLTSYSGSTSTGRSDLWHIGLLMAANHPFQGVGVDNFQVVAPSYLTRDVDVTRSDLFLRSVATEVHNTYLDVLVGLGLVGLVLFLGVVTGALAVAHDAARRLARSRDRDSELLARGLVIGTVGMLTAYFFFSAQFEKQLWLILGALVALSTVAAAPGRSPGPAPQR
jgi:O-antigen ligase